MDVSFDFFVCTGRKFLFKDPQQKPSCLTEMHTNTAIIRRKEVVQCGSGTFPGATEQGSLLLCKAFCV